VWIGWVCEKDGGVSRNGVVDRSEPQLARAGHANLTAVVRQGELHAVVASGCEQMDTMCDMATQRRAM